MGSESKYIWVNGRLVEYEKATTHLLTAALHYGAAVFEGVRAYQTGKGTAVFRLKEHADRLLESAEIFGFRDMPWTTQVVAQAVKDTVKANGFKECYIRPLIYLDGPPTSLNLDTARASLMIAAWEWATYLGEE